MLICCTYMSMLFEFGLDIYCLFLGGLYLKHYELFQAGIYIKTVLMIKKKKTDGVNPEQIQFDLLCGHPCFLYFLILSARSSLLNVASIMCWWWLRRCTCVCVIIIAGGLTILPQVRSTSCLLQVCVIRQKVRYCLLA